MISTALHEAFGFTTALIALILDLVYYVSNKRPAKYPPGPWRLPFIGNLHQLGTHPFIKFMAMRKKYGDIIAIDFASYRGVVLNDAKLIREALSIPEFCGRPKLRPFLERLGHENKFAGIITNEGPGWAQSRRFAYRNLRDFGMGRKSMESLIQDEIHELLNTMDKYGSSPFKTKYIFNLAAVNSLWWILIGERFSHDDPRLQDIVKKFTDGLMDSPAAGAFFFFPWLSRLAPDLTGFNAFMTFQLASLDLVRQKYLEQRASFVSGVHRHFLDVFIQEVVDTKDPASAFYGSEGEKNLVACIVDFFVAGIETTSTSMSWAVMLLALNPAVQDSMHEEVKSVTHGSRAPTLDDEPNLPYVQAVMTEVLRLSSILPLSVFHSTTADVEFHGFRIPKDTMIMPNLYGTQHDPAVWGDPEVFRPERFMTADGKFTKTPQSQGQGTSGDPFMPFSVGKRQCIGESLARNTLFLFLANTFARYKIEPNPEKPRPVVDYTPTFVLQPMPYEYVLHKRSQ